MKKRILAFACVLALSLCMAAGCSGSGNSNGGTSGGNSGSTGSGGSFSSSITDALESGFSKSSDATSSSGIGNISDIAGDWIETSSGSGADVDTALDSLDDSSAGYTKITISPSGAMMEIYDSGTLDWDLTYVDDNTWIYNDEYDFIYYDSSSNQLVDCFEGTDGTIYLTVFDRN